ncbi:Phosphoribosyltransferase [Pseudomonas amygdali pv. myricae]|uniref:phosphoribosyltransferase family protein n=1 Tax=Pseudomonas amygdali TaxID=47877 RepID=UPI000EFE8FC4|nr:phosphoribosyltransferase family protein [Pseudomonas amygdali]RMV27660.1 Phosphoribosyltransferase [Pseudomonas amygdali pv. myricae]
MNKPVLPISYEYMDRWIASLQPALLEEAFSSIIGVLRGGAPIALMISHATGVEPAFLRYRRADRSVTWDSSVPLPPPGSKVLLCQDIAGAGHTLKDCLSFLQCRGLKIKILTVGFDDLSSIRPDYGIDGRGYFLQFPWERQAYTCAYRDRWKNTGGGRTGQMAPDHEYDVYAIDLDGILLPDIPHQRYAADLHAALYERDHLEPFKQLPPLGQVKAIITGRPEIDRVRTQAWLSRHGHGETPMIMRDTRLYNDSPEQVSSHKAQAALQLGCTHFVESDPVQAILIAQHAPLLRVIWWDVGSEQGRLIGAAAWEPF